MKKYHQLHILREKNMIRKIWITIIIIPETPGYGPSLDLMFSEGESYTASLPSSHPYTMNYTYQNCSSLWWNFWAQQLASPKGISS